MRYDVASNRLTSCCSPSRSPTAANAIVSVDGGTDTSITFVNKSGTEVSIYWVDTRGSSRHYADVAAGADHYQHTYSGHAWRVEEKRARRTIGQCVATVCDSLVEVGDGQLTLTEKKTKRRSVKKLGRAAGGCAIVDATESPDGRFTAAIKETAAKGGRTLQLRESAPGTGFRHPELTKSYEYAKPGDDRSLRHPCMLRGRRRKPVPLEGGLPWFAAWSVEFLRWHKSSKYAMFLFNERGHQMLSVFAVDTAGRVRTVVEERSPTFIDYSGKQIIHFLADELLWSSERDGYNHLYLYDLASGQLIRKITTGQWVVRGVEHVDEGGRTALLTVSGIDPDQDPYCVHYVRVDVDGREPLLRLTRGDGTHRVRFGPERRYYVDEWSRVDLEPVVEVRRSSDGELMAVLESGQPSIGRLAEIGWTPPERFAAPGRDGQTLMYGIVVRPTFHDGSRRLPVIEHIYAGPHSSFVPKAWSVSECDTMRELAELGFIVVQVDGMGTSNRSKAFHDTCWRNVADAGLPDRICWMKALAQRYPSQVDLDRVGIYGGSAGGQSAMGALLFHPEFYKAAAADCGCHDNRSDKQWWNEAWMGFPIGPHYEAQSNATNASRLQGRLLLTVGELDTNVDPASTMQVVKALIANDKDFELVVFPSKGHGAGESSYGRRRRMDFFVRSLIGVEPRAHRVVTTTTE
ncbi:Peptidase S9 prolyl oligopeptidase catalytic domain-containing protein [Plasmodiophora brassicae]|nr:hypothetical protein PBRA_006653 [Plasmodiophora brassicae]